jgi:putative cardiolipin synthase
LGVVLLAMLAGCAGLPPPEGRHASIAPTEVGDTRLGRAVGPAVAAHPGLTGIHPLPGAMDAFVARVVLAAAADRSLDVQYYIWHGDQTGYLLFEALWHAAERGVRVRLLLDDNGTAGLDPTLAALDVHPAIEVRLYNPLVHRDLRLLDFVTDFGRVNRRMHNKSFTADNRVAIVGGRNVGNEYYGAGSGVLFADLDVLAVGQAVAAVSEAFDRYWNSESAYPASSLTGPAGPGAPADLAARFASVRTDPAAQSYLQAVRETPLLAQLLAGRTEMRWSPATLVVDDPSKTRSAKPAPGTLLISALLEHVGTPRVSLDLVSPYFVPGEKGTETLAALARSGVAVRVLTNSLAATDVGAVHAGYAKRRLDLLRAGVRLFELKPTADPAQGQLAGTGDRAGRAGGSSGASLHAKTFAVDRRTIFVGSFNFDPRSALINTEMGLVIDHPALAGRLAAVLDTDAHRLAWEVRLAEDGRGLVWIEHTPGGEVRHGSEPGAGVLRRLGVGLMSVLPIEWLL